MKVSHATATAHAVVIGAVTSASTTAELRTALGAFSDLRHGAPPGTAPGVPADAADGHYQNGYHLLTKRGEEIAATALHSLPHSVSTLWDRLDEELRVQDQMAHLASERSAPGRPATGRAVAACLPDWLIVLLDAEASAAKISRSRLIFELILEARQARG